MADLHLSTEQMKPDLNQAISAAMVELGLVEQTPPDAVSRQRARECEHCCTERRASSVAD